MIYGINGIFKVNIAKKCCRGLEFCGTKMLAQFKNYEFLYLTMMYPHAKEMI